MKAEKEIKQEIAKPICRTCFGDKKVTIIKCAGFLYDGPPYKIKCPTCQN